MPGLSKDWSAIPECASCVNSMGATVRGHLNGSPVQVYRATLTQRYGGGEVAVKVQRPDVRKSVALDLLLMRQAASLAQRFPQVCC
jgi:hypothetical protein